MIMKNPQPPRGFDQSDGDLQLGTEGVPKAPSHRKRKRHSLSFLALRCTPFRSAWCAPLDALEAHLRDIVGRVATNQHVLGFNARGQRRRQQAWAPALVALHLPRSSVLASRPACSCLIAALVTYSALGRRRRRSRLCLSPWQATTPRPTAFVLASRRWRPLPLLLLLLLLLLRPRDAARPLALSADAARHAGPLR